MQSWNLCSGEYPMWCPLCTVACMVHHFGTAIWQRFSILTASTSRDSYSSKVGQAWMDHSGWVAKLLVSHRLNPGSKKINSFLRATTFRVKLIHWMLQTQLQLSDCLPLIGCGGNLIPGTHFQVMSATYCETNPKPSEKLDHRRYLFEYWKCCCDEWAIHNILTVKKICFCEELSTNFQTAKVALNYIAHWKHLVQWKKFCCLAPVPTCKA